MEDSTSIMLILMLGPTVIGLAIFGFIIAAFTVVKVVKGLKDGEDQ